MNGELSPLQRRKGTNQRWNRNLNPKIQVKSISQFKHQCRNVDAILGTSLEDQIFYFKSPTVNQNENAFSNGKRKGREEKPYMDQENSDSASNRPSVNQGKENGTLPLSNPLVQKYGPAHNLNNVATGNNSTKTSQTLSTQKGNTAQSIIKGPITLVVGENQGQVNVCHFK